MKITSLVTYVISCLSMAAAPAINLAGNWQVQLQSESKQELWSKSAKTYQLSLPGALQSQGIGNEINDTTAWLGTVKSWKWIKNSGLGKDGVYRIPVWLQPKRHYIGKAWYQRTFEVTANQVSKPLHLHLERVHISSTVWIDGKKIGSENSLSTPHRYNVGTLSAGKHTITICVNNNKPTEVGNNAHSVSDHTQTTWNGIIGEMSLKLLPANHMEQLILHPNVATKQVKIDVNFYQKKFPTNAKLELQVTSPEGKIIRHQASSGTQFTLELGPNISLWDEFSPCLYKLQATLTTPSGEKQVINERFGMVQYQTKKQSFLVNGRKTFLRGTLDCASFPLTAHPSTDPAYWRKVYRTCKAYGLNHVRFHSWCPPEVAFDVADEMGVYLMAEHAWSQFIGEGRPVDQYLIREGKRVVTEFGNHPSFMVHSYGNEPSGKGHFQWLEKWVDLTRKADANRRLYTSAAGWSVTANSDFIDVMNGLRVYPWGAGLNSSLNKKAPESITDFSAKTKRNKNSPFVAHETGQWCAYPDFNEIKKYTGPLQARNYEVFQKNLIENTMGDQAKDFLMASGRLQTLCYKNEIEKLLRTPGVCGYQLLGLNDFPGQGSAIVGAVDVFWDSKSYSGPKEYSQFNSATVPLAKFPKFVFTKDEAPKLNIVINHHGAATFKNTKVHWQIKDTTGKTISKGLVSQQDIPIGLSNVKSGFHLSLHELAAPAQYKFVISVGKGDISNQWDFWVYPTKIVNQEGEVKITRSKTEAIKLLQQGEKVLLIPAQGSLANPGHKKSILGFSSIFWNTCWANQAPTTLGILCKPKHPIFASFPTEYHSNYQWWYLIEHALTTPINLDVQQPKLRPLVQVIDDWFSNRRLGLVVEASYGKGKLIISSVDLSKERQNAPVINQFRFSLLNYMNSSDFSPEVKMTPQEFSQIFNQPNRRQKFFEIEAKDQAEDHPVTNLLDGRPKTIWHTNWQGSVGQYPHRITLKGSSLASYQGILLLPRQDNANGRVKHIIISVSNDGNTWKQVAEKHLPNNKNWQKVPFKKIEAKYIRLDIISSHNPDQPWASFAELKLDTKK